MNDKYMIDTDVDDVYGKALNAEKIIGIKNIS